jgi:hypothetical protein
LKDHSRIHKLEDLKKCALAQNGMLTACQELQWRGGGGAGCFAAAGDSIGFLMDSFKNGNRPLDNIKEQHFSSIS